MDNIIKIDGFCTDQWAVKTITKGDELWFVAADVCNSIDISNVSQALTRLDDDEKDIISNDTLGGKQEMVIISESGLYSLVLSSRKPDAKEFKRWITHDVIPSIRKTGVYAKPQSSLDILSQMVKALQDQEKKQIENENRLKQIEAKIETSQNDFYSMAGYCSLRGLKVDTSMANMLGRKATKLSNEYGYEIGHVSDPRFGKVNTYHLDILSQVIDNASKKP